VNSLGTDLCHTKDDVLAMRGSLVETQQILMNYSHLVTKVTDSIHQAQSRLSLIKPSGLEVRRARRDLPMLQVGVCQETVCRCEESGGLCSFVIPHF